MLRRMVVWAPKQETGWVQRPLSDLRVLLVMSFISINLEYGSMEYCLFVWWCATLHSRLSKLSPATAVWLSFFFTEVAGRLIVLGMSLRKYCSQTRSHVDLVMCSRVRLPNAVFLLCPKMAKNESQVMHDTWRCCRDVCYSTQIREFRLLFSLHIYSGPSFIFLSFSEELLAVPCRGHGLLIGHFRVDPLVYVCSSSPSACSAVFLCRVSAP